MVKRQEFEKIIKTGKSLYAIILDRVSKLDRHNTLIYSNAITDMCFNEIDFNKVYKTQAEAEWVAKMYTQRTEFFEPPIYEEFSTNKDSKFCFYKNGYKYVLHNALPMFESIRINKLTENENIIIFEQPLTKRNYIKACEYARNLFLGKENENEN